MPFVETRLISPTTLTTSAASALYTVPTGYSAIIKQLVVTNITGTAATFTFYIGAASAGNALFSGTSVAANDTVIINLSQVLSTGEVLRALASTGSALNLTVSGVINDGPLASTATYIADNAITVNKIADGSVTTAKIAAGAVMDVDVNASAAIDQSKIANLTSDLALKAPLASPALTGTPTSTTAAAGTNTTQIATMASKPWNTAWGFVAQATLATTTGYITAIQDILSITFTSVANRRYRYTATGLLVSNSTGHINASFCESNNTNLREFFVYFASPSNAYMTGFFDYTETITTSGSVTRKIRHHETSTPGVLYYGSSIRDQIAWKIRVEDIGPA